MARNQGRAAVVSPRADSSQLETIRLDDLPESYPRQLSHASTCVDAQWDTKPSFVASCAGAVRVVGRVSQRKTRSRCCIPELLGTRSAPADAEVTINDGYLQRTSHVLIEFDMGFRSLQQQPNLVWIASVVGLFNPRFQRISIELLHHSDAIHPCAAVRKSDEDRYHRSQQPKRRNLSHENIENDRWNKLGHL